jgi:CheY-like chemotaxis protein
MMPDMDGPATLLALRSEPGLADVSLLLLDR